MLKNTGFFSFPIVYLYIKSPHIATLIVTAMFCIYVILESTEMWGIIIELYKYIKYYIRP